LKKFLFLGLIGCTFLYSFDITMRKEFVKEIKPNTLGIVVTISTSKKELKGVIDSLSNYSAFIKSFKNLSIKGGEFNTAPQYRYSNNKSKMTGYKGSMIFQIDSREESQLKNFISMLTAKSTDQSVQLFISSKSWYSDAQRIKKEQDDLRFQALSWADEYASVLSDKTGKSCNIKSVNFDKNSYNPPVIYKETKVASDQSIAMPKKSLQRVKVDAKFIFECD